MLVSVIIPVYNCADHVSKAIQSILDQTYTQLQILILNDGSTDDSDKIIRRYSDKRIQYISSEVNTRKIGIVNQAFSLVKGDLIAFQDADDWSDRTRIEKQVKAFDEKDLIICFTGYSLNGVAKPLNSYRTTDVLLRKEFHNGEFITPGGYNPTVCATMMFRSNVLKEVQGYHEWFSGRVGEDLHLVYRIMKYGKAVTVPEDLYYYHYNRPGSFTYDQTINFKPELVYSYAALAKLIEEDIRNGNDILQSSNETDLLKFELEACKEALVNCHKEMINQKWLYENSTSMKIGKAFLTPWKLYKKIFSR
jgi:glycosyltransferase involved in cell wall biosynthesis